MTTNPGLRNQASVRTTLRVVGPIVAVVGIVVCALGFAKFVHQGDTFSDASPLPAMGMFAGGFIAFVVGMGMTRAGFMGAGARYAVGELAPVAKNGLEYLTDGKGLANLGVAAEGPSCSKCGTRNDASAKFCDSCGASLA